ncbi:MAG: hypothetical protein WC558_05170 [Patulibacter sp.]
MNALRRSGAVLAMLVATLLATAGVGVAWAAWSTTTRLQGSATAAFLSPVVLRVPHITGTAADLETLTAVDGLWGALSPSATVARQWLSCTTTLTTCTAIASATGTTYVVPAGSVAAGTRYVLRERVTNGPNVVDAVSVPTDLQTSGSVVLGLLVNYALVATTPPAVTTPTTIVPGSALSVTSGTWQGRSLLGLGDLLSLGTRTYTYQWLRCGPIGHSGSPTPTATACVNATGTGATTANYTANAADVGQRLRVRVTASSAQALGTTATGRLVSQATTVVAPS